METDFLTEILAALDPASCSYQEWVTVGMGLKESGRPVSDWDEWSRRDAGRYHPGECEKKWETFQGTSGAPVTGGSIYQIAVDHGWTPPKREGHALDWDDEINAHTEKAQQQAEMSPADQLICYLHALFDPEDKVGYVTDAYEANGRLVPGRGAYDRTARELVEGLKNCGGDIGKVFGDWNEEAGGWIRFNPLDGQGVKNDNVTDYLLEGLMRSLIVSARKACDNPADYEARSNIMWAATLGLNTLTGVSKTQDWEVHMIEHQVGAYTDCAHGAALGVISVPYYKYIYKYGVQKFKRFAENVFDIDTAGMSDDEAALKGIDALGAFIKELGIPENLRALGVTEDMLKPIADSAVTGGGYYKMEAEDILKVLKAAF